MQSDELEESVRVCAETPEMTFGEDKIDAKMIAGLEDEFKLSPSGDFKLEGIDLEADIEKMIPDSPASSESTEEEGAKRLAKAQQELQQQQANESIRTWLQRITQMQNEIQKKLHVQPTTPAPPPPPTPSRVVKYQDLPYMGEMTLDNSKPRRGRKPKKADICHLIYKNYGTIFPGTPNAKSIVEKSENKQKPQDDFNRTDVQNRIISSLLEKRLTQESKRQKVAPAKSQSEPLNLCIRDLDHLKIRLSKDVQIKSEPQSDDDVEFVHETPSPNLGPPVLPPDAIKVSENGVAPGGYVYWPNAGVFIHPMALQQHLLYYQKLAANNNYTLPNRTTPEPQETQQAELRKLLPKKNKKLDHTNEPEDTTLSEHKTKRISPCSTDKVPAKRKRSAIFIPPIPAENQNNPATEVSICKFKFTGGAKPSLQEKKMLSVDSGGNFRYYSGTGDKSMRGYEFFPRETLQQQVHSAQGSSTGAFLQASGEKIYPSSPVDFVGKVNEFMLTPEIKTPPPAPTEPPARTKKRKSRKSLQREKLEQTFKEKGFLIQTQQLESAEGATYCKFRQLRKFTRYLFRSWKDYLPGNVEGGVAPDEDPTTLADHDLENISNLSSPAASGETTAASPPPTPQPPT